MGDQINLQEARLHIVPLGNGANGDLPFEPTPRPGRGQAVGGMLGARRGQEPPERGGAGLPHQLVDGGRHDEFSALGQTVEQLRHEGLQAVGADVAGRLPQHRCGAADLGAVPTGAAAARIASRAARRAPQQADDRFAMQLRDRHDLIEQRVLVRPARELSIALALADGIFAKAEGLHGFLLELAFGNRDF